MGGMAIYATDARSGMNRVLESVLRCSRHMALQTPLGVFFGVALEPVNQFHARFHLGRIAGGGLFGLCVGPARAMANLAPADVPWTGRRCGLLSLVFGLAFARHQVIDNLLDVLGRSR